MFRYAVVLVGAVLLFMGCAPKKLIMKGDSSVEEIALCLQTKGPIPDDLYKDFDSVTTAFVSDYNSKNRRYKLINCQNDNERTLYLDVLTINVTDPGIQTAGVVLTTIGTVTPFAMIAMGSPVWVWFGYLPRSRFMGEMYLSDDISVQDDKTVRKIGITSPKYFGSYEDQKELLLNAYCQQLRKEMSLLERHKKR